LAPPVNCREAGFEVVGASFPAYEVGGDLIDAIRTDRGLTCFVADVSGHGVPAGTLMAALKSAARMRLLASDSIADLFTDLNRVLFAIKQPSMFATAACMQINSSRIEYCLAGHLPILHWSQATRQIVRVGEGQIALGIVESEQYLQYPIEAEPGDVLAVVTDGLTEVTDRRDHEVGVEGIERVLAAHAEEPLPRLFDQILSLARTHGRQQDDQTLLLVRIVDNGADAAKSGQKRRTVPFKLP